MEVLYVNLWQMGTHDNKDRVRSEIVIFRLDLGVHFDETLSFREHTHAKINNAYMMLGIIKRNF